MSPPPIGLQGVDFKQYQKEIIYMKIIIKNEHILYGDIYATADEVHYADKFLPPIDIARPADYHGLMFHAMT